MDEVSEQTRRTAQAVEFVEKERCPYGTDFRICIRDIAEQCDIIQIADIVLIKNFIGQREKISQLEALRPNGGRSEIDMDMFKIEFEHCDRIRVLEKCRVVIIAVIFFAVVDVSDNIFAVRKFEDAGERRK